MAQNYKKALNCKKCPGSSDKDGCPLWWEFAETFPGTGETRMKKACGLTLMPQLFFNSIAASDTQSASENGTRNAIIEGFDKLTDILSNLPFYNQPIKPAVDEVGGAKQIAGDGDDNAA